jgi:hypothetical protein
MSRRAFENVGLPLDGSAAVKELFFNPPSSSLLALVGPPESARATRIFLRTIHDTGYKEMPLPFAGAIRRAVVSSEAPIAFLLFNRPAGGTEVISVTLPAGQIAPCILPSPHYGVERWISALLGASADGRLLYVIIASRPFPEPITGYLVHYDLSSWSLETGSVDVIDPLATPGA